MTTSGNTIQSEDQQYACPRTQIVNDYFVKISTQLRKSAIATVCAAQELFQASNKWLSKKEFNQLCHRLGYEGAEDPTISKYKKIGSRARTFLEYQDQLPNSWTSLYKLTTIPESTLRSLFDKKEIHANMTGKQIQDLAERHTFKSSSSSNVKFDANNDICENKSLSKENAGKSKPESSSAPVIAREIIEASPEKKEDATIVPEIAEHTTANRTNTNSDSQIADNLKEYSVQVKFVHKPSREDRQILLQVLDLTKKLTTSVAISESLQDLLTEVSGEANA